jgi:hypothetical protein
MSSHPDGAHTRTGADYADYGRVFLISLPCEVDGCPRILTRQLLRQRPANAGSGGKPKHAVTVDRAINGWLQSRECSGQIELQPQQFANLPRG